MPPVHVESADACEPGRAARPTTSVEAIRAATRTRAIQRLRIWVCISSWCRAGPWNARNRASHEGDDDVLEQPFYTEVCAPNTVTSHAERRSPGSGRCRSNG